MIRWLPVLVAFGCVLAACVSVSPTPQQLPTRAPTAPPTATSLPTPTSTPAPAPTATPFTIPAITYHDRGVERQRAGDAEAALSYYAQAIERDPELAEAYVARGSIYLGQGNLEQALREAQAALDIETSADAYLLRAEALRRSELYRRALDAFDQALERDPSLRTETFQSRWSAAREAGSEDHLRALGDEYAMAHTDDALRHYYQAWGAMESNEHREAIEVLVEGIDGADSPPALLWYLLGRAYAGVGAWPQAITSLEAARSLVRQGDVSLDLHTERPVVDLFTALGHAYLPAGRCLDAEAALEYSISVGASPSEHQGALQEAQLCQTPTPTASPYPTTTPSR